VEVPVGFGAFFELNPARSSLARCGWLPGIAMRPRRSHRTLSSGSGNRAWDTRTGTIDLAIPKLREGSYFPDWLLEPRRCAEHSRFRRLVRSSERSP
jgi:hypothetical protein